MRSTWGIGGLFGGLCVCSCSLEQMDFCTEGKVTKGQKDREREKEITKSMPGS